MVLRFKSDVSLLSSLLPSFESSVDGLCTYICFGIACCAKAIYIYFLLWSSLKAGIKFDLCVLQLFSGRMFSLHRQQFAVHVFASSRLTISGQAQFFLCLV